MAEWEEINLALGYMTDPPQGEQACFRLCSRLSTWGRRSWPANMRPARLGARLLGAKLNSPRSPHSGRHGLPVKPVSGFQKISAVNRGPSRVSSFVVIVFVGWLPRWYGLGWLGGRGRGSVRPFVPRRSSPTLGIWWMKDETKQQRTAPLPLPLPSPTPHRHSTAANKTGSPKKE
jgi:hypothetical protein